MSLIFVFILMIFCHIVDDYYLQGWLASAKQKKWWKENAPQGLYKYDYIVALIMHSFSWSFMIMLPIVIINNFQVGYMYVYVLIVNMFWHASTDNLKANKLKINLIQDQITHIVQIIVTFIILTR